MEDNTLAHYGVLGMRWGVRKDGRPQGWQGSGNGRSGSKQLSKNQNGSSKSNSSKEARKEAKRKANETVKNRSTLSDSQLNKKIERLKKQRQLKELTDQEYNQGKAFVTDVLKKSGKALATAAVTGGILYLTSLLSNVAVNVDTSNIKLNDVADALKNNFNPVDLANKINNQAKK